MNDSISQVLQAIPRARFDHVAIATKNIRELLPLYVETLGGVPVWTENNLRYGFHVLGLKFAHGGKIELLQQAKGSQFLDKFLSTRPNGGLHHITFHVPNIADAQESLLANGLEIFGFSADDPHWKEFFINPKSSAGVLVQFAQTDLDMDTALDLTIDQILDAMDS